MTATRLATNRLGATGLEITRVGLGVLTRIASTRVSLLAFAGLLSAGILAAAPALLGHRRRRAFSQPRPIST